MSDTIRTESLEEMAKHSPNTAKLLARRGVVSRTVATSGKTRAACIWDEYANGTTAMVSGSRALYSRLMRRKAAEAKAARDQFAAAVADDFNWITRASHRKHLGGSIWQCTLCGGELKADCSCCEPPRCNCQRSGSWKLLSGTYENGRYRKFINGSDYVLVPVESFEAVVIPENLRHG
jgi:hypothetical protein